MEDNYRRNYVPAFGSWDWNDDLPFTQCFESSKQQSTGGLLHYDYNYSDHRRPRRPHHDRDLYVAGDLYHNQLLTPAMIVVPRSKVKKAKKEISRWVSDSEAKKVASPTSPSAEYWSKSRPAAKPVDEDLYKISPELLYAQTKKKGGAIFLLSCLLPTCVS